nr:MAG: C-5 cytosine-specific DNA methylase [Bacteriophage sp.]
MIKILIGGSPCTYWSVAQKKGREVEAEGLGWELFRNYLIAKEKFKPDFFLYENNKSAAQPIKDQISHELGVDLMHINSALVSAQNRQRFYAFNWNVDQPADRGIMLKDILETTTSEKGYELRAPAVGVGCRNRREDDGKLYRRFETSGIPKANALTTVQTDSMVAEPIAINTTVDGKAQCIRASCYKDGIRNLVGNTIDRRTCVAEPIRIGTIENGAKKQSHDSKQYRVYSPEGKATTLCGEGGGLGAKTGLYAAPVRVGTMPNADGEITGGQAHRIYDASGKAVALCARPNGGGPETGLYAYQAEEAQGMAWRGRGDGSSYEARDDGKANALTASGHQSRLVVTTANGKEMPIYEVINGEIEIKGKKYPIKLPDGFYIIRKLTPVECERLQTLPDGYTSAVSATQRYRGLGNGWTAEVIIHILTGALKDVPRDEQIVVLSMYDGIGTGRYCLDKMGFTNVTYYAYEIDKPAMTVALSNYPDIIQLGDAFDLRRDDWELGKRFEHTAEQKAEAPESHEQTTDLSDAPEEIKEQIIENDRALKEKDDAAPTPLPEGFDVVDQLYELLTERKKLHIIDEENLRYNCDIVALEYAIGALRR